MNYINREEGHAIFFKTAESTSNGIENLYNTFYISKKGEYNLTNGNYEINNGITYTDIETATISGKILNRNLQLFIKLKIESRETDYKFFNPEII